MTDQSFTPSESSLLTGHLYDPDTQRLTLQFRKGGNVAHYHGVEPQTYEAFAADPSHGAFFHSRLKTGYRHEAG